MPISIVKFLFKHDYQNNVEQHFSLAYYSLFPCLCLSLLLPSPLLYLLHCHSLSVFLYPCLYPPSPLHSARYIIYHPCPKSRCCSFSLISSSLRSAVATDNAISFLAHRTHTHTHTGADRQAIAGQGTAAFQSIDDQRATTLYKLTLWRATVEHVHWQSSLLLFSSCTDRASSCTDRSRCLLTLPSPLPLPVHKRHTKFLAAKTATHKWTVKCFRWQCRREKGEGGGGDRSEALC